MLRGSERKEALASLKSATNRYEVQAKDTQDEITALFLLRQKCSKDLIARGENFVNRLANTPKEFDKSWSELKAEPSPTMHLTTFLTHILLRITA